MKTIRTTGVVSGPNLLRLDADLPMPSPGRVRVIVLVDEKNEYLEKDWLKMAASNPVFADLADSSEDIYSLKDGKRVDD
ncbi:MAG: hypothetical protein HZB29_11040 [Nitrospinae bacterium]|nr:hypothetical protein [Nitrospinota bacterium]